MTHTWLRSWNTLPQPDEQVLVALYRPDGTRNGYVLAYWRDGEWQSESGEYSWPRLASLAHLHDSAGLLWKYVEAAPENAADIAGRVAA